MTEPKLYRHRFAMTIIQHAVWLYHRFTLSDRDVQELLYQRGIQISHETLREWCIKFAPLLAEDLRHRDEVCTSVNGVRHWLWRAVDEHRYVLDIFLQRHRDTEAVKSFLTRLLGEYDVPEVIHTDQLRSYGAAIREIPSLTDVDHQQVISTARCNNIVEQEHRSTRRQERSQQGFKRRKRAQEFLSLHARISGQAPYGCRSAQDTNLHHHSRTSVTAATRRSNQRKAFQTWSSVVAGVV